MHASITSLIDEISQASAEGRLPFSQVINQLAAVGVESYVVDYRAHRTTYYLSSGETRCLPLDIPDVLLSPVFDAQALQAAIRGAQRGEVQYPAFKRLSGMAGCIGYTVWITGRHVTYFGRRGKTHVEALPD